MIIGIAGHARHGKDSIADVLVSRYGFHKQSLANPMKEACRVIFGWTDAHLYGDLKDVVDPAWGISPRHAMQSIGTQWGQFELGKYDDFAAVTGRRLWVNSLLSRASGDTVIADVRFPHEEQAIHDRGGIVIMVRRPGWPVDMTHESEQGVEEVRADYVIRNGLGLSELADEVRKVMEEIGFSRNH